MPRFTESFNFRVVMVYGGTGISKQIAELLRCAEIIVCTPGRTGMIDMLTANDERVTNFRRVTGIALDKLYVCLTWDLSHKSNATSPRQMEALAMRILNKPIEITVGGRSVVCADAACSCF